MNNSERFRPYAAVYLLLVKDNQILLLRRYNTGFADGYYSLIAGHIEGNETIAHAIIREAKEEAGITLEEKDVQVVHAMHRISDKEYIDFFLVATTWEGEPTNTEPQKCDNMQWFPIDQLPENILPYVAEAINNYKKQIPFSERNDI